MRDATAQPASRQSVCQQAVSVPAGHCSLAMHCSPLLMHVEDDGCGEHSHYRNWHGLEVMYEIAPLMSCLPPHRRKALIGNTIVTIIFQEDGQFDPSLIVSQVLRILYLYCTHGCQAVCVCSSALSYVRVM